MVWSIFSYESEFIDTERVEINMIPCLKLRPKGASGLLPTIIYYHGWHSSKDFQRFKAVIFACYGYQVIVPDAMHHGERNPIDYDAPGMLDKYFWEIIFQNVKESGPLIEEVIKNYNADPNRIGVMGNSMGGISAAGVFTFNSNLKCLVDFNGSCAWVKAEKVWRQIDGLEPMSAEEISKLSKYDPMMHKDMLDERPILLLHGDSDTSVPIDSQRIFYNEVSPLYKKNPEKLKFVEFPKVDHSTTTTMLERAIEWFKLYL